MELCCCRRAYYWLDVRMDHAGYARTGSISHSYFLKKRHRRWAGPHQWEQSYSDWLTENARIPLRA